MTSCMCKSCLVLPVKEEFAQFATIIAFGPFCFYFLDGIKNWIESVLSWTRITVSETRLKKIVHVLSCAGDHVYRVFILQSESWRIFHFVMWIFFDTSVVRTFASLIFWLALWTFAWLGELSRQHANTPTRRKIARKLGDISKRIEREIRSHYFCNTSH